MPKLPSIESVTDLRGTRVLVRVSLNVPVRDGVVTNEFRLRRIMPTITFLRERGAKVVLMSHIGREATETLHPVYEAMQKHIPLTWCPKTIGDEVVAATNALEESEVLLLENLRQDPREKANDPEFAAALAALGDIYVNEAFAASHREHASIVGVPQLLPAYAGLNFLHECEELSNAAEPESPSLFVLGGAKFETKLPLVEQYANTYSHVFIGGALANDFFKAQGYEVGTSLVSDIDLKETDILNHQNILLPIDVTVTGEAGVRVTTPDAVASNEKIVDAGPRSIETLAQYLTAAKTILWNGPLGYYEDGFDTETEALAQKTAAAAGYSIVGGGDTIASIEKLNIGEQFDFLSTAGGAMLAYLENGSLPGIEAIRSSVR